MTPRFRVKIANFSRLHCLAITKRDLRAKKTKPYIEKCPESLAVISNLGYSEAPGKEITHCTLDPGLVNLYFYTLKEPNIYKPHGLFLGFLTEKP